VKEKRNGYSLNCPQDWLWAPVHTGSSCEHLFHPGWHYSPGPHPPGQLRLVGTTLQVQLRLCQLEQAWVLCGTHHHLGSKREPSLLPSCCLALKDLPRFTLGARSQEGGKLPPQPYRQAALKTHPKLFPSRLHWKGLSFWPAPPGVPKLLPSASSQHLECSEHYLPGEPHLCTSATYWDCRSPFSAKTIPQTE
jgi:hypothetical protein